MPVAVIAVATGITAVVLKNVRAMVVGIGDNVIYDALWKAPVGDSDRLLQNNTRCCYIYTIVELSDIRLSMEGNIPMFGHVRSTLTWRR